MQLLSGVMLGLVNLKIREAAEAPINIKLAHCAYEKKQIMRSPPIIG
jgi:hypothetical protein